MNVSIQKLPKSQIELTVEIPSVDFGDYFDKAVESLAKNLEIKGFRKGSVPKEMAENYLSQKDILEEAANLAVNNTYPKAIEENKIEAVDLPKIAILKVATGNPFIYKATVSVLPEIKLPDYKKIAQKINEKNRKSFEEKTKVEEKEIDDSISWLQKSRAKYITVNREARVGDFVKLNIKNQISKIDAEREEHEGILGQGYFLPDFEKNLIGMRAGDKKSFFQSIPETHANKEVAGKTFDFEVELNLVSEVELPEANDDFAKSLGQFENLGSLKHSISEGIKIEKEEKEKQKNRQELMEEISKESKMEVPDILVERKLEQEIHRLKHNIEDSGMNFDDYLKSINPSIGSGLTLSEAERVKKTEDDLKKDFRDYAQNQVKIALTLREISKIEGIKATDEEIREKINEYLKRFSSIGEAKKHAPYRAEGSGAGEIDQGQLKLYYEDAITNEKVFQLLEKL